MKAKLVKEILNEDLIDKVRERRFGILDKDEHEDFNKYYAMQQLDKNKSDNHNQVVASKGDFKLIKNPTSIKDLQPGVRGVISPDGNLYMGNIAKGIIHVDIIEMLIEKGILPKDTNKNGWGKKLPQESGFLTVQRYKDTNYIAIGESNKLIYDEADWKEKIKFYNEFLQKAKKQNPNLVFTNKLVGIKIFKRAGHDEETAPHRLSENYDDQKNLMINFIKNKKNGI